MENQTDTKKVFQKAHLTQFSSGNLMALMKESVKANLRVCMMVERMVWCLVDKLDQLRAELKASMNVIKMVFWMVT